MQNSLERFLDWKLRLLSDADQRKQRERFGSLSDNVLRYFFDAGVAPNCDAMNGIKRYGTASSSHQSVA